MGARMSALPLAAYCGRASGLDTGAGRAAAMSTAWHAHCDFAAAKDIDPVKQARANSLLACLSAEERETVDQWRCPEDVQTSEGVWLRYPEAERELEVGLNAYGEYVPNGHADLESLGHLDFAWSIDGVAYVGDLKKTGFTATDGVESLQLIAYGFAYASLRKCHSFCCGIWAATEGRWTWGDIIELDSPEALTLWKRCLAAIRNVGGEFSRGAHCRNCYSRFQCPAYLLPPEVAQTTLAPLATGGLALNQDNALVLLRACEAVEDTLKVARSALKDFAAREGGILGEEGSGKVYKEVYTSGKESLDQKALFEAIPQAKEFVKKGKGFTSLRWVNAK